MSMGFSSPERGLFCVVETCSEDTFIEHKKLPPDDFLIIPSLDHTPSFSFCSIQFSLPFYSWSCCD